MDSGAAASIPREKGEGAGGIYFFQLLHLSQLSLSAFCGDSSVELVAVNPFGSEVPKTAPEAAQESLPNGAIFLAAPAAGAPSSAPSPTRAQHAGDGGDTQSQALSDGGAVPGSWRRQGYLIGSVTCPLSASAC